jgi:hypothetical protein
MQVVVELVSFYHSLVYLGTQWASLYQQQWEVCLKIMPSVLPTDVFGF